MSKPRLCNSQRHVSVPPRHLRDGGNIHLSHRMWGRRGFLVPGRCCVREAGCASAVFRHKISVNLTQQEITETEIHPRSCIPCNKTSDIWHQRWAWRQQRPKGSQHTVNRGWESREETVIRGLRKEAPCCVRHAWQPLTYSEGQGTRCTEYPTGLTEEAFRKMLKMPNGFSAAAYDEHWRGRSTEGNAPDSNRRYRKRSHLEV